MQRTRFVDGNKIKTCHSETLLNAMDFKEKHPTFNPGTWKITAARSQ